MSVVVELSLLQLVSKNIVLCLYYVIYPYNVDRQNITSINWAFKKHNIYTFRTEFLDHCTAGYYILKASNI